MKSFLTGSQVYGAPGPDSDIDLVILVDRETVEKLAKMCDKRPSPPDDEDDESDGRHELSSGSFYFGKLNLIAVTDETAFAVWKAGTNYLVKLRNKRRKPITTEEATAVMRKLRETMLDEEYSTPTDVPQSFFLG